MNTAAERKKFSLTSHLVTGAVIVHLVLLPMLYTTIISTFNKSAEEQFIGHAREVAGLFADMALKLDPGNNKALISGFMDDALLTGEILFIEIEDAKGNFIRPGDSTSVQAGDFTEDDYVGQHSDNIYFISIPVAFSSNNSGRGILRLGFDETVVMEKEATVKRRTLLILAVYFAGILLLLGYFTSVITRPLRTLRNWSRNVAHGETDLEVDVKTRIKEVDYLSLDLEKMRMSLLDLAERMHHKAMHDDLTGLPNRALNSDRIMHAVTRASRESGSFAILLLDLDRFKDINDTLGHGIGDEVLRIVAERLQLGVRKSDTVSRIGGDEFCAVIDGVERVVAENMAVKLSDLIEQPFHVKGHSLQVGASIGIAVFPVNGATPELLIQRADVAMYEAKYQGLQVASYHEDMDKHKFEDLQLTADLRDGLKTGQLEAIFQPKVDLATGRPVGCELLSSWKHPRIGIISADKFIPLAERENLIGTLTRHIFEKYAARLATVIDKYPGFKFSLNVSPLNLLDTSLLDDMKKIMKKHKFDYHGLMIEVTENAIMTNPVRTARILEDFSNTGIQVSVDDFGTGYSSLSYLQKFPITELKIDKSFIVRLTRESHNYPIVNATIAMAHDLNMTVIAEGVEDKRVLEILQSLECDQVQGHFFSESLSFDELVGWLDEFDISDYQ